MLTLKITMENFKTVMPFSLESNSAIAFKLKVILAPIVTHNFAHRNSLLNTRASFVLIFLTKVFRNKHLSLEAQVVSSGWFQFHQRLPFPSWTWWMQVMASCSQMPVYVRFEWNILLKLLSISNLPLKSLNQNSIKSSVLEVWTVRKFWYQA